jgi:hypothetical protein
LQKNLREEGFKSWQEGAVFSLLFPFSPKPHMFVKPVEEKQYG